ncbi:Spo0E family sporulation regulatory protein-aspartic acid phosphatase [Orenia metallireducens]|uniref:Spo0E family sporulation regulatory protein-aspartic acid phosphatase n=1 Tax=Orenia metallireducens TaxID=1413210 RepID=UPI00159F0A3E|nr:Spo0E family sporulation regulatory protein-aspartic acid phosphatase [Orenia metallireducens]
MKNLVESDLYQQISVLKEKLLDYDLNIKKKELLKLSKQLDELILEYTKKYLVN